MDIARARRLLTEIGWLAAMPREFGDALLRQCDLQAFEAGETVYLAGDPPGGIYGICEGALGMTSALGPASAPVAHLGQPGAWTGMGPLLTGQPRRATMQAMTPLLLAHVPLRPLQNLLGENPQWWLHIAQGLLMEFDTVTGIANDLLIRSADRRCAAALLRVANCRRQDPPPGRPAIAPISQESLAEMINLSRSRISPILSRFSRQGLTLLEYRAIKLLDVRGLRAIADDDRADWT
jgi:CRP/FNR family transcriptional regulator, cyclic AMP receptor protein